MTNKRHNNKNFKLIATVITSLIAMLFNAWLVGQFTVMLFLSVSVTAIVNSILFLLALGLAAVVCATAAYKRIKAKKESRLLKTAVIFTRIAQVLIVVGMVLSLALYIKENAKSTASLETVTHQFPIVVKALNKGFLQTLKLFGVTLLGALPLGLLIAFGSMSQNKLLSRLVRFFVWVIRGTPLMLQLLIIFYLPGLVFGKQLWGNGESARFLASAVAFIINYSCYFSEIYRGGIQGVPVGQQEAGQVLGLSNLQIFFRITLMQMIKRIVPPMSNEIITLVKDTSRARISALQEVIWAGQAFMKGSEGISGAIWPLFFTGVYYLIFSGILTLLFGWVEKKLSYFKA